MTPSGALPSDPPPALALGSVAVRMPPPPPAARPRPRPRGYWVAMAVGFAVGSGCALAGLEFGERLARLKLLGPAEALVLLAWLPLSWLVAVAWHECGHLLAGRSVGGRFLLLTVGPFKWVRTPAGVRFGLNRSLNAAGGLAASLPTDDRDLGRRLAVMVAGGPAASLVLAAAMALVVAVLPRDAWPLARGMAMALGAVSAVICLATLVPLEAGGMKSDGLRLWTLWRGGPAAEQEAALLSLSVAVLGGVRPADYDPAKLAAATTPDDGSVHVLYGQLSAFYHHADRCEWPAAQARLDRVVAGEAELPAFMREVARAEYAWLLGAAPSAGAPASPELAVAARAWLGSAGRVAFDPATRHRAEAAVLLAEGRRAESAAAARAGLIAAETKSMSPVRNLFAADALAELLRRAEG